MNLDLLKNVWYVAALSAEVKSGKMHKSIILNQPIVIYRDSNGKAHALRDICPHRGIPLSYGWIQEDKVVCPYHGWKFNGQGVCTEIPSLCSDQDLDSTKIKVRHYPLIEQQGLIWLFIGDKDVDSSLAPKIPVLQALPMDVKPKVVEIATFKCHIDHAVIGLMDPAHGPYIHRSWLWRSEKSMIEKRKKFAPVEYGFQMVRHKPSANSKAYKILGGEITTEITFTLPGIRVEHIRAGTNNLYAFTGLTPINEKETIIYQVMYWDLPLLTAIKPFMKWFTHFFLYQDIEAVEKQQDGLRYDPTLMLIKDADTQAKWYYALKDEWQSHQVEKRSFHNPIKETELRWRS